MCASVTYSDDATRPDSRLDRGEPGVGCRAARLGSAVHRRAGRPTGGGTARGLAWRAVERPADKRAAGHRARKAAVDGRRARDDRAPDGPGPVPGCRVQAAPARRCARRPRPGAAAHVRRVVFQGRLDCRKAILRAAVVDRFGTAPQEGRKLSMWPARSELLADRGYLRATVKPRPPMRQRRVEPTWCSTWTRAPEPCFARSSGGDRLATVGALRAGSICGRIPYPLALRQHLETFRGGSATRKLLRRQRRTVCGRQRRRRGG